MSLAAVYHRIEQTWTVCGGGCFWPSA